jgi:FdhD protein
MRTPGHDFELAAGFLFSEGVVEEATAIWRIDYCEDGAQTEERNIVEVFLTPGVAFDPQRYSRNVYTTSSCGVCGKTSIDMVRSTCAALSQDELVVEASRLTRLHESLLAAQPVFQRTGGLHAAALFDREGDLHRLREDVGRHNALDKLVGSSLLERSLPASDRLLLVSGRASFELVQKAAMAGIPLLAAVGAPSSLAVELAREVDMTLVAFLKADRFNVYSGARRITRAGL